MPSNFTCCGCWPTFVRTVQDTTGTGRRYRRAKYNEREYSIEFENLVEEEDFYPPSSHVVTEVERDLLARGKYRELYQHESTLAQQQDARLQETEENARLEDEAYIQAKREAARVAKQTMDKTNGMNTKKKLDSAEFSKWLSEENIDINSPELDAEDFESFLEKVRARGTAAATSSATAFEQTLTQGLAATKIAGDALNALQPQELHAVTDVDPFAFNSNPSSLRLPYGGSTGSSVAVLTTSAQVNSSVSSSPIVSQPMAALREEIFGSACNDAYIASDLPEADLPTLPSHDQVSAAPWNPIFDTGAEEVMAVDALNDEDDDVLLMDETVNESLIISEPSSDVESSLSTVTINNDSSQPAEYSFSVDSTPAVIQTEKLISPLQDEAPSQLPIQENPLPMQQNPLPELQHEELQALSEQVVLPQQIPAQVNEEKSRVDIDHEDTLAVKDEVDDTASYNGNVAEAITADPMNTNVEGTIIADPAPDVVETIADPVPDDPLLVKVVDPVVAPTGNAVLNHQDSGVAFENSKSGSDDDFCDFDDDSFTESTSGLAFEEYLA